MPQAHEILESTLAELNKILPDILITQIQKEKNLSSEEKEHLQKSMNEIITKMSNRYRELFKQKINFSKITEQISYPLYDKYFTEDEIKDLITFYKTATGKKSIKVLPQLFSESIQKSNELLSPIIQEIIGIVIDEEKERILKPNKQ